ncbi:N-acetyltransferase [Nitrosomonas sp.]|uniref:N-acetyltransferase n=1 Tax=Nitrosomonas sp. TaxID=42353 RepID=UPI0025ECACDF|nr:N-acetyltransferase [Nitrosomonas sp.]MCC6916243.1 N-acetyltransferase [Nitrosomonas sp.]
MSSNFQAGRKIEIIPVSGFRGIGKFIDVPWQLFADDPVWVPPLRLERRLHLSRFNPYFKHAQWQGWIACQDNQPVGRISAQIDELHRERYGTDTGHFGMLESIRDEAVFSHLIQVAESWLIDHGAYQITGPFNFSINQECGLLVQGFDTPPVFMMPYSPEWYAGLLEQNGYRPCRDLLAYWLKTDFEPPSAMQAIDRKYQHQIRVRPLQRSRFNEEIEIMRDIFNDAWSDNWGFVPFTKEEFAELGSSLRWLVPDEFIQIAEMDGVPVAFMAVLPNLNEVLPALNGKLFPFGLFRLISKLKSGLITTGRVPLMGVRRQFHNTLPGIALAFKVIDAPRKFIKSRGIGHVELSWILEDNQSMRTILEKIGGREYKRYRIYEKTLA